MPTSQLSKYVQYSRADWVKCFSSGYKSINMGDGTGGYTRIPDGIRASGKHQEWLGMYIVDLLRNHMH